MREYRLGSHLVFKLRVHVACRTKYRKEVLVKDVGYRVRELSRQICSDLDVEVLSGVVAKDHVYMLVSMPPQISASKLMQKVKGKTSYKLQREFQGLRKEYWGPRMWARGYFACSTGNVSDEMVRAYIDGHTDKDERFRVFDGFEPG